MKILITGVAGFIGFHLAKKLIEKKIYIIGIDSINNYYDQRLKLNRLSILRKNKYFKFFKADISNYKKISLIFKKNKFDHVINLAASFINLTFLYLFLKILRSYF